MLCYVILCYVMLCCVVLCCVVLCCAVLCCVVLCYIVDRSDSTVCIMKYSSPYLVSSCTHKIPFSRRCVYTMRTDADG